MVRTAIPIFLWASFGVTPALAQGPEVPIIEAGREEEILALFAPYELGGEVRDGYRLMNVAIDVSSIDVELVGPDDASVTLRLTHPDLAESSLTATASFAVQHVAEGGSPPPAADALIAAVRDNDEGRFYRRRAPPPRPTIDRAVDRDLSWLFDGLVACLLGFAFFLVLAGRELTRGPRPALLPVVALTTVGVLLRVSMSPATMMGAWPFSRTTTLMRLLWNSPTLAAALEHVDGTLYFFDLVTTVNLVFAFVTPAAVYLHAKKLLEDDRAALLAAAVVTLLPVHLRFSQSEVAFIPSIALSSFTFALVHTALKEKTRWLRLLSIAFLPLVAAMMFMTRPLNQIFLPLLLWTALYLSRRTAPLGRRIFVSLVVAVVGVLAFVYDTIPLYRDQIAEGASVDTVVRGVWAFFLPTQNTLLHPWVTPLGLTILAVGGAWATLRARGVRRERGAFLVAWLLLFYVAHAYVLPRSIAMQARYHLHLVVPFVMLAALAMGELYKRRRALFWAAALYVALVPFFHRGFIRDVAFNDMREYAFVRKAARRVPAGCTVMEYTGSGDDDVDVRFDRAGEVLQGKTERRLYAAVPIGTAAADGRSTLRPDARALVDDPPECLYYYQGLFCYGRKAEGEPMARACAEMDRVAELEEVMSTSFVHRLYDGNLSDAIRDDRAVPIVLGLYRVVSR